MTTPIPGNQSNYTTLRGVTELVKLGCATLKYVNSQDFLDRGGDATFPQDSQQRQAPMNLKQWYFENDLVAHIDLGFEDVLHLGAARFEIYTSSGDTPEGDFGLSVHLRGSILDTSCAVKKAQGEELQFSVWIFWDCPTRSARPDWTSVVGIVRHALGYIFERFPIDGNIENYVPHPTVDRLLVSSENGTI